MTVVLDSLLNVAVKSTRLVGCPLEWLRITEGFTLLVGLSLVGVMSSVDVSSSSYLSKYEKERLICAVKTYKYIA